MKTAPVRVPVNRIVFQAWTRPADHAETEDASDCAKFPVLMVFVNFMYCELVARAKYAFY